MATESNVTADCLAEAEQLSVEELRALIPQLQQLTEKYKRSESIQKALFDISELSGSVNDLSQFYPAVHQIIGELMNAQNFFVALHQKDTNLINYAYVVDRFDDQFPQLRLGELEEGSITAHILHTGKHVFITQEKENSIEFVGEPPVDLIGVPLTRGEETIGVIVVQSYDETVRYHNEDLEILLVVSRNIVSALDRIKNRELTEQTINARTKQLSKINQELQDEILERQKVEALQKALFEISELAASNEGEMQTFYASLHSILAHLISAPNCYIATLNESRDGLDFPYYSDDMHSQVESRPLGKGLTEFVLRTGRAELIDPARATEMAKAGELDPASGEIMAAEQNFWLGSPLVVDGELSGVIVVQAYGEEVKYTFKDLELLRFVSHHIAVAMERKKATDAIQQYNQQLAEKIKERTDELHKTNLHLQKQIEQRKEVELKLIHDAHHDALTGLANRVMFNSRLELAIASKKRHQDHEFAILFIDLDRFKLINDTLGHHAGDEFLIEVSKRIAQCIRAHDLLARLGGDEFVILLDSFGDPNDVEDVATRVIESIAAPFVLEGKEMFSGASIGVAYVQSGYQCADELLRDADAAMYQAKSMGRGRFVIFDKSMREKLLEELELENEFRRTLKLGQFECYTQPAMTLENHIPLYHECFIRWRHPGMGNIKREQFCQVAEHSGLTIEIDLYILRRACELLQHWQSCSGTERERKVAINLSINHLTQSKLVKQLTDQINQAGIDPGKLVFEFDENDLNRRAQFMLPAIRRLKKAGVTLVLDNFGSGLASLSYLYSYPFDYVKIDHRFVKSIPRSQRNLKLIQSVMLISEHLDFQLIAEGVETEEQYLALRQVGCEFGQGNYLQPSQKIKDAEFNRSLSA